MVGTLHSFTPGTRESVHFLRNGSIQHTGPSVPLRRESPGILKVIFPFFLLWNLFFYAVTCPFSTSHFSKVIQTQVGHYNRKVRDSNKHIFVGL